MPRPNKARTISAEAHLARRIAIEREKRGWTYEGLADRMLRAGCAIQASALFKIEKGQPPRRVTVDELAALSEVLLMPLQQLISDPAGDLPAEGWDLYEKSLIQAAVYSEAQRIADQEFERFVSLQIDYNQFVEEHPEATAAILDMMPAQEASQQRFDRVKAELGDLMNVGIARTKGRAKRMKL